MFYRAAYHPGMADWLIRFLVVADSRHQPLASAFRKCNVTCPGYDPLAMLGIEFARLMTLMFHWLIGGRMYWQPRLRKPGRPDGRRRVVMVRSLKIPPIKSTHRGGKSGVTQADPASWFALHTYPNAMTAKVTLTLPCQGIHSLMTLSNIDRA